MRGVQQCRCLPRLMHQGHLSPVKMQYARRHLHLCRQHHTAAGRPPATAAHITPPSVLCLASQSTPATPPNFLSCQGSSTLASKQRRQAPVCKAVTQRCRDPLCIFNSRSSHHTAAGRPLATAVHITPLSVCRLKCHGTPATPHKRHRMSILLAFGWGCHSYLSGVCIVMYLCRPHGTLPQLDGRWKLLHTSRILVDSFHFIKHTCHTSYHYNLHLCRMAAGSCCSHQAPTVFHLCFISQHTCHNPWSLDFIDTPVRTYVRSVTILDCMSNPIAHSVNV
jgi:hypothetical protein